MINIKILLIELRRSFTNKKFIKSFCWRASVYFLIATIAVILLKIGFEVSEGELWFVKIIFLIVIPIQTYLDTSEKLNVH